jgi:tetratricopeptide (TPR) repeat protein
LWAGLLGTGFWANNLYLKYDSVLQYARATNDYAGAASRLEPLIVSDPLLAALYYEQGFLYGMAANEGDKESAEKAIRAYQQFIDFEPHYATAYANLAALQWRSSEQDLAIQHMETAAALAWDNWSLNFEWGRYAEEVEKLAIARNAYETALTIQPDAALLTVWDETTLRQEIATSYLDSLSNLGTTAWQLKNRNITAARETWNAEEIDRRRLNNASSIPYIIHMLIALGEGKRDEAEHQWTMARATARNSQDGLWLGLGEAALARYDGDEALADEILNRVRQDIRIEPLGIDYPHGWNIIYAQFWRTAIPRQFLPQVNFVAVDPVLLYLLED